MSDKNLAKIVNILTSNGYRARIPVNPLGIANKATREEWIHSKHMKALNFYKDDGLKEVDIIIESPVSYDKAKKTICHIKCGNITLPVISIDNLIKMKKATNRNIDKIDIEKLQNIRKLRKKKK